MEQDLTRLTYKSCAGGCSRHIDQHTFLHGALRHHVFLFVLIFTSFFGFLEHGMELAIVITKTRRLFFNKVVKLTERLQLQFSPVRNLENGLPDHELPLRLSNHLIIIKRRGYLCHK